MTGGLVLPRRTLLAAGAAALLSNTVTIVIVPAAAAAPSWEPQRSIGMLGIAGAGNKLFALLCAGSTGPTQVVGSPDEGGSFGNASYAADGSPYLEDPLVTDGTNVAVILFDTITTFTDFIGPRPCGNITQYVSTDGGSTFPLRVPLCTSTAAFRQSTCRFGKKMAICWMDIRGGNWDLYFRETQDFTVGVWSAEQIVVSGSGTAGAERPKIGYDSNGDIHLVWMDGRDNKPGTYIERQPDVPLNQPGSFLPASTEVYYKNRKGGSWGPGTRLTSQWAYSGRPWVCVGGTTVVVAFDSTGSNGNWIRMRVSNDAGNTWGPTIVVASGAGDSSHSAVTFDGSRFHAAWQDNRAGGSYKAMYSPDIIAGAPTEIIPFDSSGAPLITHTTNYIQVCSIGNYSRRPIASAGSAVGSSRRMRRRWTTSRSAAGHR